MSLYTFNEQRPYMPLLKYESLIQSTILRATTIAFEFAAMSRMPKIGKNNIYFTIILFILLLTHHFGNLLEIFIGCLARLFDHFMEYFCIGFRQKFVRCTKLHHSARIHNEHLIGIHNSV